MDVFLFLSACCICCCVTCELSYLLHLELDGALELLALGDDVVAVEERRGELAGLVETATEHLLDLLDDDVRGEEGVVGVGELGDGLLGLVELLEVVEGHARHAVGLGLVAVLLVAEHAHAELRARHILESIVIVIVIVIVVGSLHSFSFKTCANEQQVRQPVASRRANYLFCFFFVFVA